jgi:hypothetical protein
MNWLWNIIDPIKWKIEDFIWAVKDKIELNKELKAIDEQWDSIEEIEAKPKKKKKNKKKTKKS